MEIQYNVLTQIVALMCVFGLGMCFAMLGSIGVKLMPRLNIDQNKFGTMISAFMFTCLLASLVMGVVVDKVGFKPVAVFGFIATAACIFILAYGKTFLSCLVPCLLLGFGAMALNTAGNTLIPSILYEGKNPAAASNMGNVFFGLGLFLTPLVVSFLFKKVSYEKAVAALGVIVLLPVIVAVLAIYPAASAGFAIGDAVALLKEPVVLMAALALFCYISLESSFCNWLAPYGKEVLSKDVEGDTSIFDAKGQQLLSVFAIAMMAGRLGASFIPVITKYGGWFIAGAAVIIAVIIIAMSLGKKCWLWILAALAGVAFAPCFPTIVGVTASKHPENFGSVFGIIFAIGLLGGVFVPKAIGKLAEGSSIQKSFKLLIPACVLLVVFAIILGGIKAVVAG